MRKKLIIIFMLLSISQLIAEINIIKPTQKINHSFAIIIDNQTYSRVENAVKLYRNAVQDDGLACYILIEKNATPDDIKKSIQKIYNNEKTFEGIVLIGDVPVPMIRDAHHLSSAFKMNPDRFSFSRSSIASDRFYDDFDLKFKFLQQDTNDVTLYYYSLISESTQIIDKEIYSARMKVHVKGNEKYELLRQYLFHLAKQKKEIHEIKNMLTFTGHGYHSESLASWEWNLLCMREQFPQLYKPGHTIKNLNHASSNHMKKIILTELQNPDLDIASFHAHGSDDTQYLNGYPLGVNVDENIRNIKLYLRSKMRQAKRWKRDPEEYKKGYKERYGVPDEWFEGAFVDSVEKADSLFSADLDIYVSDLDGIKTQPKFVMFDECYNGQFTKTPYIAGKYLFSGGNTIVTVANTVNVKQDIWADEFLGMINLGVRIGEWHKTKTFLESHLIGDPTFHFNELPEKLIKNLYSNKSAKYWKKQLKNENPVYRGLAVDKLYRIHQNQFIPNLLEIYNNDPSSIVRLQALKCLAETRSKDFEGILHKTINDPAEMIRRITTIWMGKIGHESYLPQLAELMFLDHSERVSRQAKESMGIINAKKAITIMHKTIEQMPDIADLKLLGQTTKKSFQRTDKWLYKELLETIQSDTMSVKKKKNAIRTFRNYSFHDGVNKLCEFMLDSKTDLELRIVTAEALGWFTFSFKRNKIIESCDKLLAEKNISKELSDEAVKTKKRILNGSNYSITP